MSRYNDLVHELNNKVLSASKLSTEQEQQSFVVQTFRDLHQRYHNHAINHDQYIKLVDRLASYKGGAYNDYLDMLVGAAGMGMLDLVMKQQHHGFGPEAARNRRDEVTRMTGVDPIEPEEEGLP